MPEATSAGGGYSCQVCGRTYRTESELIQHGKDQHPNEPVAWGDTRGEALRNESKPEAGKGVGEELKDAEASVSADLQSAGDKMKAGARAMGSKMSHPETDLKKEYEKKKAEEKAK